MTSEISIGSSQLAGNVSRIQDSIANATARTGRNADDVTLVAVTKTFPRDLVDAAYDLGIRQFGENRVQEAREKYAEPRPADARLALIGNLQSNKVRQALAVFNAVHTVDRASIVDALAAEAGKLDRTLPVLVQVNIAREPQKSGCDPDAAAALVEHVAGLPHLACEGLFMIAPLGPSAESARPWFRALVELRDSIATDDSPLPELSMGMSGDYVIAIEEGATQVRIGSALFGRR